MYNPPVLILVPGHGLSNTRVGVFDPGAQGNGASEADVVSELADRFIASFRNVQPVTVRIAPKCSRPCSALNHPTSTHLGYMIRYLNGLHPETILALHMNASDDAKVSGCEVMYSKRAMPSRRDIAAKVSAAISQQLQIPDRGPKRSDEGQHSSLGILDETSSVAYLLELGFITNKGDLDAVMARGMQALVSVIDMLKG